jgi:hypothetical protein
MKTRVFKTKFLKRTISVTLFLIALSAFSFAKGNLDKLNSAANNGNSIGSEVAKADKSNVDLSKSFKMSCSESGNFSKTEKELNAITQLISETIKYKVNTNLVEFAPADTEANLNDITEQVVQSIKFQPETSL